MKEKIFLLLIALVFSKNISASVYTEEAPLSCAQSLSLSPQKIKVDLGIDGVFGIHFFQQFFNKKTRGQKLLRRAVEATNNHTRHLEESNRAPLVEKLLRLYLEEISKLLPAWRFDEITFADQSRLFVGSVGHFFIVRNSDGHIFKGKYSVSQHGGPTAFRVYLKTLETQNPDFDQLDDITP